MIDISKEARQSDDPMMTEILAELAEMEKAGIKIPSHEELREMVSHDKSSWSDMAVEMRGAR